MTDAPKRRWFQFHLSTALVMMLVTGSVMWVNLSRTKKVALYGYVMTVETVQIYGWPIPVYDYPDYVATDIGQKGEFYWRPVAFVIDGVTYIAAIALVAVIFESIIRRRGARRR